ESSQVWEFRQETIWYRTWWFLSFCATMAAVTLAGGWWMRLHLMRKRFSLVLAERERLSRDIHDTLLQGLVGSVVQLDAISRQFAMDPSSAQERLRRTRRQLVQYITETRESIRNLRSSMFEMRSLGTALRDVGQDLTRDASIEFQFITSGEPCG